MTHTFEPAGSTDITTSDCMGLHWASMILNELVECRSLWGEPEGVRQAVNASTHNKQCMALRLQNMYS